MKIRQGFVSNSSSSSFVVILPSNFIETIKFEEHFKKEKKIKKFKKFLDKFIKDEGYWRDYDNDDEEEDDFYEILSDLINPYIVADIDGGSDDGDKIIVLDHEKIKKLLV